ncbi:MAG: Flp pilus assembly complex ATPase component [bacterium]|nr:Flp pilus assembly complex ATPase component [bacterium]
MSFAQVLLQRGKITRGQYEDAKAARQRPGDRLERILIDKGYAQERDVLEIIGEQLSIPVVSLEGAEIDHELLKLIPSKLVHRCGLFPIDRSNGSIRVATSNPFDLYAFDELRMLTGSKIEPVLATEADIQRLIKQYYGVGGQTIEDMLSGEDLEVVSDTDEVSDDEIEAAQEATVVKLVNEILVEAIRDRASDVHIEPYETDLRIRYRIDGVLHTTNVPPEIRRFKHAIISRIKILSDLNIAEKRLPQDGAFNVKAHHRDIDIRVSIIPTAFGEAVVMRILDKQSILLNLTDLGLEGDCLTGYEDLIRRPHGINLVTGPTGSGKTTTLYSALNAIRSNEIKILTVEDPIEYFLEGINQVQVRPKIGLTFAHGLRAFLRHDPDVILVGEIRDLETAEVAINASLTGHLVFSTLHTNDAPSATTRLLEMGIEPFLVTSSVSGIVAQRLVRLICPQCREEYEPDYNNLPPDLELQPGERLFRGAGCRECRDTGYKGRFGIFELLCMTDEIRELIIQRASATEIRRQAMEQGMTLLRQDGLRKVRDGRTTIEEVTRVAKIG